mmetsp:Transcript_55572/g.92398  ORF Transcript_55572/g.92398 Transcript_55572/m.92398 type:complete len:1051 (+) Transcript_55572:1233-4385(+)
MQSVDWDALLKSSSNLTNHDSSRIQRSFSGIEKEAQRLSAKPGGHVSSHQLKDFALSAGVDIRSQGQYISAIDAAPSAAAARAQPPRQPRQPPFPSHPVAPTQPPPPATVAQAQVQPSSLLQPQQSSRALTVPLVSGAAHPSSAMDLSNFLKYHHEFVISSTIQQCHQLNAAHFDRKYTESTEQEWDTIKRDILNYFGCKQQQHPQLSASTSYAQPQPYFGVARNRHRSALGPHTQPFSDDVSMSETAQHHHPLQTRIENEFGKIVKELALYRHKTTPLVDYDRNAVTDQYVQRTNIVSPISRFYAAMRQICDAWPSTTSSAADRRSVSHLVDLWHCASAMVFEHGMKNEGQYAAFYGTAAAEQQQHGQQQQPPSQHLQQLGLQRLLVNGARKFLEHTYLSFMQQQINDNKFIAKRGGKPGQKYIVKAFVRLKYQITEQSHQIPSMFATVRLEQETFPIWPLLFYAYRIGDIDSCVYFAQLALNTNHTHNNNSGSHKSLEIICECLQNVQQRTFEFEKEIVARRSNDNGDVTAMVDCYGRNAVSLDEQLWQSKLYKYYQQYVVKQSRDPFEQLMYVLLGKLFSVPSLREDIAHILELQTNKLNFVWLKLATLYLCKDEVPNWMDSDAAGDASGLDNSNIFYTDALLVPFESLHALQCAIKHSLGPTQFEHPMLFAMALLLTQQFEDAVNFLLGGTVYTFALQGIHLGVCLNFYGLLRRQQCDIVAHILQFLNAVKADENKQDWIFFYLFMANGEDELVRFLCEPNQSLRQSVVGTIQMHGIDVCSGLLYKYCGVDKFLQVCKAAAQCAYQNGEIEHCVSLQLLLGDFDAAAKTCIKSLSSHIKEKGHDSSVKQFIVNLSQQLFQINESYLQHTSFVHSLSSSSNERAKPRVIENTNKLNLICAIHFAEFYDLYYQATEQQQLQLIDKALNVVHVNDMIPIRDEYVMRLNGVPSDELVINELINEYKPKVLALQQDVKKYFGELCLCVMRLLAIEFERFRACKQIESLKSVSKKCEIIYAFFNHLEDDIKPMNTGDDVAKNISSLYYKTKY